MGVMNFDIMGLSSFHMFAENLSGSGYPATHNMLPNRADREDSPSESLSPEDMKYILNNFLN